MGVDFVRSGAIDDVIFGHQDLKIFRNNIQGKCMFHSRKWETCIWNGFVSACRTKGRGLPLCFSQLFRGDIGRRKLGLPNPEVMSMTALRRIRPVCYD
jgi:hypothetical protein